MILGLDRHFFLAGIVGIGFFCCTAFLSYRTTRTLAEDAEWVAHTYDVIGLTGEVLQSNVDAETGTRAFVITNQDSFLEPYRIAIASLPGQIQTLRNKISDNESQRLRVDRLEKLTDGYLAILDQTIKLRHQSEKEAHAFVVGGTGKAQLDAIRTLIAEMSHEEHELLLVRERESRRAYVLAVVTGLLAAVVGSAVICGFVGYMGHTLRSQKRAAEALYQQQEWLRTTLVSIGDGVIATDIHGCVIFMNEVAQSLTGWTEKEASGRPLDSVFRVYDSRSRTFEGNLATRAILEGNRLHLDDQATLLTKQEVERSIDDSVAPIRNEQSQIVGAVVVFRDVTEKRRSETALRELNATLEQRVSERTEAFREQEERFRTAFDFSSIGMAMVAPNGRLLRVNQQLCDILGYREAELLATDFQSITHPDDLQRNLHDVSELLSGATKTIQTEKRHLHKNGSVVDTFISVALIRDVRGDPSYMIAQIQDISQRKKAEALLRVSEERLRLLVEGLQDYALYMLDASGNVNTWNAGAERMKGYKADEIIGKHFSRFYLPEDVARDRPADTLRAALATGRYEEEGQRMRKDGTVFWADVIVNPLYDGSGHHVGFAKITRDITAKRQVEEDLQKAKVAAEQASRAKSDFLATMSHEIRTPMNGVLGMAELALDTDLDPEQREYIETVKASAEALLLIINDILDFSKIEAGKLELDPTPFSLRDGLADLLKQLALRAHKKGLELICDVHPDVPDAVFGDLGRLRQILVNLVGNAIKFTEHGEVIIRVSPENRTSNDFSLRFAVIDTGIGIPAAKQQVIFAPFEQADGSMARKHGGTGLGLAISSRLAELMGGRVWVESRIGKGSTFYFTVRFQNPPHGVVPNTTPFEAAGLKSLPVLIVDDNAATRAFFMDVLTRWGMRPEAVPEVATAVEALARAEKLGAPMRLVFVDSALPNVDELLGAGLIVASAKARIPVVLLLPSNDSGHGLPTPYRLRKPVKQSDLLEIVQTTLADVSKTESAGAAQSSSGQLTSQNNLRFSRPLRILVAEDNRINQRVILGLLQKAGHQVVLVSTGKEAIAEVLAGVYDVVLMDVQMPEMSGLEATSAIREAERDHNRHIPIIALTAHAMQQDVDQCLAAGMDAYVAKPLRSEQLRAAILQCVPGANEQAR